MHQQWLKAFLLLWFFLSTSISVFGQDISFQASVDKQKTGLDSTIVLDLTATGVQNTSPMQLPEIDGFKSRYIGPSTSISIINGQQTSSVSQKYLLYPQKVGLLTIPAFAVTINNQQYETQPIEVEVLESMPAQSQPSSPANASQPTNLADKAFLRLEIPKEKVYVHERLPVTIKLYVNHLSLTDIQFPTLGQNDFVFGDFGKPAQYQDILGGVAYDVVEFNTAAYPTKEGVFTLGPAQLNCNIAYKRSSGFMPDFGGFSDDFFNNFFGNYEKEPFTVKSKVSNVTVLPLPEGAPQGFSSAVGQFHFQLSANPLEVNVGDPITVKMRISGDGDLKTMNMPVYKDSKSFKVYDPQIKQQGNVKTLEQVLIPRVENVKQVPAISFVYFDPQKQTYETINQGPFALIVHPAPTGKSFEVIEGKPETSSPTETLGRDIIFIKEKPGAIYAIGSLIVDGKFFLFFAILYAAGVAILLFVYRKNIRMKTDTGYAKRLRAPQKARKGLRDVEHFMKADKPKEFYDAAYKVLYKYFTEKFLIPGGMITADEIHDVLLKKNISLTMIEKVKELFSTCEMMRYGAITSGMSTMQKNYQKLKEILDFFGRR